MTYSRKKFIKSGFATFGIGLLQPLQLFAGKNADNSNSRLRVPFTNDPWQPAKGILMTRWSKQVNPENVWPEYPRPQMSRQKWKNLNGLWDYTIADKTNSNLPAQYDGKILVPFCIESPLSGVMQAFTQDKLLWYQRECSIPADWAGQKILLHFGAVDWETTLYIDGKHIGTHRGGFDGFSFDITKYVKAGNAHNVVISVWDPTDTSWILHGKQTLHPAGCSYSANSGIWQTVWMEPVPTSYIEHIKCESNVEEKFVTVTINARTSPKPFKVRAIVKDKNNIVAEAKGSIGVEITTSVQKNLVDFYKATSAFVKTSIKIPIKNIETWTPETPFLYDITVHLVDDQNNLVDSVDSYFGMRSLKIGKDTKGNTRLLLNGKPVLMPGALDQGYWPDGVYLAPTDEALRFDIEWAKKLGLNTVRKHVKVESQRWYYWADKLGLMVFQDMPTGWCGDPQTDNAVSPEAAAQWRTEISAIIQGKINHPSIICWSLFNEAFGGFDYVRNAEWAKQLDPGRLISESSGFPWHGAGDVRDSHSGVPDKSDTQISIISEDGTPSLGCTGHQWPHSWTYHSYDPATGETMDFLAYYNKHPDTAILPSITPEASAWLTKKICDMYDHHFRNTDETGLTGDFYCQIVDVETENNGFMSYDREVSKIDPDAIAKAIRKSMPTLSAAKV